MKIEESQTNLNQINSINRSLGGKWHHFNRIYVIKTPEKYLTISLNIFERVFKFIIGNRTFFWIKKLKNVRVLTAEELSKVTKVSKETFKLNSQNKKVQVEEEKNKFKVVNEQNVLQSNEPIFDAKAYATDPKCPLEIKGNPIKNDFLYAKFLGSLDSYHGLENKAVYFTYPENLQFTPFQSLVQISSKKGIDYFCPVTLACSKDEPFKAYTVAIGKPYTLKDAGLWHQNRYDAKKIRTSSELAQLREKYPQMKNWWWGEISFYFDSPKCSLPVYVPENLVKVIGIKNDLYIGLIDPKNGGVKFANFDQPIYCAAPLGFEMVSSKGIKTTNISFAYRNFTITLKVKVALYQNDLTGEKIGVVMERPELVDAVLKPRKPDEKQAEFEKEMRRKDFLQS